MNLQEVDTIQDLKEWVKENMPGAGVSTDMYGNVVIHTNLVDTMGGYLYPKEDME
jgi:hypothetical protein